MNINIQTINPEYSGWREIFNLVDIIASTAISRKQLKTPNDQEKLFWRLINENGGLSSGVFKLIPAAEKFVYDSLGLKKDNLLPVHRQLLVSTFANLKYLVDIDGTQGIRASNVANTSPSYIQNSNEFQYMLLKMKIPRAVALHYKTHCLLPGVMETTRKKMRPELFLEDLSPVDQVTLVSLQEEILERANEKLIKKTKRNTELNYMLNQRVMVDYIMGGHLTDFAWSHFFTVRTYKSASELTRLITQKIKKHVSHNI